MDGIIFDIVRNSYVDGPGIRTTVFFKGCNLKCKWCHNPESQNAKKEILFYKNKCTECGRCKDLTCDNEEFFCFNDAKEICGKNYSVDEVFLEIVKDKDFYETSGGGVTFSGGECLLQSEFLVEILKKCRENGIHTAVDTAGNVKWEVFERVMPYVNVFLYDIKCFSPKLHAEYTGVSNTLILENLKKLSTYFKGDIYIRIPIIPEVNDSEEELKGICDFLEKIRFTKLELLPYHLMGKHKYEASGQNFTQYKVPSEDDMAKYNRIFRNV